MDTPAASAPGSRGPPLSKKRPKNFNPNLRNGPGARARSPDAAPPNANVGVRRFSWFCWTVPLLSVACLLCCHLHSFMAMLARAGAQGDGSDDDAEVEPLLPRPSATNEVGFHITVSILACLARVRAPLCTCPCSFVRTDGLALCRALVLAQEVELALSPLALRLGNAMRHALALGRLVAQISRVRGHATPLRHQPARSVQLHPTTIISVHMCNK